MLAEVNTAKDAKQIADKAAAAADYARRAKMGLAAQNYAAAIKLRAERRAGELLRDLERGNPGEATKAKRTSSVGHTPSPYAAALNDAGASRQDANRWQRVADVPEERFEQHLETATPAGRELSTAGLLKTAHVAHNSGNNEWYTPGSYIDAAHEAMGGIDLDPASSHVANKVVRAATHYTAKDNGLEQAWGGRVWMNPPYEHPLVADFCKMLATEYAAGRVRAAVALTNNATETKWWQGLAKEASAVCFPAGRVRFWALGKTSAAPLQGQSLLYLGPDVAAFEAAFSPLGMVFER